VIAAARAEHRVAVDDHLELAVSGHSLAAYETRIAGTVVRSTLPFEGFRPGDVVMPITLAPRSEPWRDVQKTQGFLADERRLIQMRSAGSWHRYEFAGLGGLSVDLERRLAIADAGISDLALTELLLGPGLLLPLAASGVIALHASAVRHAGRIVLLCGVSGSGKSSFARSAAVAGAEALVDDIAPCRIAPRPLLLPRFPQLKWPNPLAVADCAEAISAIVFIERGTTPLQIQPLPLADARLRLIRHTVAARLFPSELLAWHLDAVTTLVQRVPVAALAWPECPIDQIPAQVAAALAECSSF